LFDGSQRDHLSLAMIVQWLRRIQTDQGVSGSIIGLVG
jgi:hypothetical protein